MTAEAAVVLPMILLFTVAMTWLVSIGVTHVRAVDAAREAARTVARGEPTGRGVSVGRRVAAAGSSIHVERQHNLVVATVISPVHGPGGLFDFVHTFDVHAQAVAVQEPES
ncbi:MAG: TadE family type IV pilus minor pilin [Marmoricola sp.]